MTLENREFTINAPFFPIDEGIASSVLGEVELFDGLDNLIDQQRKFIRDHNPFLEEILNRVDTIHREEKKDRSWTPHIKPSEELIRIYDTGIAISHAMLSRQAGERGVVLPTITENAAEEYLTFVKEGLKAIRGERGERVSIDKYDWDRFHAIEKIDPTFFKWIKTMGIGAKYPDVFYKGATEVYSVLTGIYKNDIQEREPSRTL